ncbi:hypothetical protein [Eubacterium sp.]|uniref:hypothetical protein n=1 Tax=Eubacterium sp. TaxID=142586 RepID=UPI002FCB80C2
MKKKRFCGLILCIVLLLLFLSGCGSMNKPVDYDLTQMGETLGYSQAVQILNAPQDYVGKTIRIQGVFKVAISKNTDYFCFYTPISDVTACCSVPLEFTWEAGSYPEDYPEVGTPIEITGEFQSYKIEGAKATFYHLTHTTVKILK